MSDLLGLEAASLGPIVLRSPPSYIGGASDEILARVARRANAWHTAQEADPAPYEELRARLLKLCEAEGRT
jgi:alkanesulfonate monooxygenase SsuD/methylene tetrahydromethanopterin reductase-like flavin-dependent oxidoreductase (luciferase family)